jgi:glycosyltransferase involved in cell wall biosynthesis
MLVVLCGGSSSGRTVLEFEQQAAAAQCAPAGIVFLHSRLDVERVLRTFDVFVNSSYLEGMSNSILEAMASDCPVVASDIAGNREVLQGGRMGNLFPPGDAQGLADKISMLLDEPQKRQDLIRWQRAWVLKMFSVQASLSRYVDFYRSISTSP